MKKLVLLLLLPLNLIAQDGYFSHSFIDDIPDGGFAVGDTITVKVEWIDNNQITPDFIHFDMEWNNKLLEKISHQFDPSLQFPTNTQNSWYQWNGYKFNVNDQINIGDLDGQYLWWQSGASSAGENSYPGTADWSVGRGIFQASSTIPGSSPLMYIKFKIKDRQGTNYSDYSNITKLNFTRLADIGDGSGNYDIQAGSQYVSLNEVTGVNAGNIVINLQTPAKAEYATDFGYSIYHSSQLNENGYPAEAEIPIASGEFDANGQAILDMLTFGETYWIHTHVNQTTVVLEDGSTTNGPVWLDEVLTVTDAYLIFQEAIGAGSTPGGTGGAFEYKIQYEIGELNNSGNVDFEDSYVALAYINGVDPQSEWFTSTTNGALNLSGMTDTFGVPSDEYYFGLKHTFTVNEGTVNYYVGHAFKGDPDFSHSFTPTADGATTGNTAQATAMSRMSMTANALKDPIQSNLDIASELIDGKVIFTINLQEQGVVGAQFNVKYDGDILTLDDVIFDTGNEMTNFANHRSEMNKVNVGSLDQQGNVSIKTGPAYKLIFTPNENIQNTSGLITFKLTEGVKADGTKVTFNIE